MKAEQKYYWFKIQRTRNDNQINYVLLPCVSFFGSFFCKFMCVVYKCMGIHVYQCATHVCFTCIHEKPGGSQQVSSLITLYFNNWSRVLASLPLEITWLCLQSAGITGVVPYPYGVYMCVGDLNSEPSPSPVFLAIIFMFTKTWVKSIFKILLWLYLITCKCLSVCGCTSVSAGG